ncbi:MAG: cation:proton antiporter [Streptococcaceae bacterium]|jgi:Kef-type K+ transport system membrane component KefB|nr:cation:proton antiporter [Streptococcaceae bacterium]
MTLTQLALIIGVSLIGPLFAWSDKAKIPVAVGEMAAGVLIGTTGFHLVDAHNSTFTFLANIGFALVMLVAGSHVPVKDKDLIRGIPQALVRLLAIVVVSVILAFIVTSTFHLGHPAIYAVLFASSSTAIIMPVIQGLGLTGPAVTQLMPQIAIADAGCIVAVPLVIDPAHALQALIGVIIMVIISGLLFVLIWQAEKRGLQARIEARSAERNLALELRISILLLLLLAALAQASKVSIMLAGFGLGIALAASGEPRRLAQQLFVVSEGFFSPLFFVWLGASINLRDLGSHPQMILLAVVVAVAAILAHLVGLFFKQPWPLGVMSAAQNGVPAAIVALGMSLGILSPGEGAALLLASLLTVGATTLAGRVQSKQKTTP